VNRRSDDELSGFEAGLAAEDAVVGMRAESGLHEQLTVGQPRTVGAVCRQLPTLQLCTAQHIRIIIVRAVNLSNPIAACAATSA